MSGTQNARRDRLALLWCLSLVAVLAIRVALRHRPLDAYAAFQRIIPLGQNGGGYYAHHGGGF